ncbi:hypothetical protein [Pseudoalteromonas luteoviolacea]|uniref:Uncharacterized protein n=1 Tax=Pseudoalteromonas luteoviolacea S4054 TaxID=1129367 RepID=A0A0F6A8H9_9GAMM|nr:hypothetical protein [Pseudoalteromonas luteoviolacea]AOT08690.1 hypothetical protein S4054249_12870 [Pseudoalteromonas luteoviolacea]AOT13605.1 hypothetical protein S40542_12845 [Pseudoalteromonas luteoviolacea]AOT18518.1 hypothetical protein S4054_12845 [Pseudoalteromonas luteoviolacea]KKE82475.1 hypothetical protein N479_17870 [Pseudoalteromonas luteoviolacea S4054]KZN72012.1 hypothetical protein N481_16505 [Pseudoalteromonas luteoviolacea S4047-1]
MNVDSDTRINNVNKAPLHAHQTPRSSTQQHGPTPEIDNRAHYLKYIHAANEEKLTSSIDAIKRYGPPVAMFRMSDIENAANPDELHGRIGRAIEQFEVEAKHYHEQARDIIYQGELAGEASKDILLDIVQLRDSQSELFKMGTNWGCKGFAHPDNYENLVAATPNYINYYA